MTIASRLAKLKWVRKLCSRDGFRTTSRLSDHYGPEKAKTSMTPRQPADPRLGELSECKQQPCLAAEFVVLHLHVAGHARGQEWVARCWRMELAGHESKLRLLQVAVAPGQVREPSTAASCGVLRWIRCWSRRLRCPIKILGAGIGQDVIRQDLGASVKNAAEMLVSRGSPRGSLRGVALRAVAVKLANGAAMAKRTIGSAALPSSTLSPSELANSGQSHDIHAGHTPPVATYGASAVVLAIQITAASLWTDGRGTRSQAFRLDFEKDPCYPVRRHNRKALIHCEPVNVKPPVSSTFGGRSYETIGCHQPQKPSPVSNFISQDRADGDNTAELATQTAAEIRDVKTFRIP
ncbi:uncharacterized protein B0I36DRAFT_430206 [Microdochium trichocladiopsis]|uniref:Uncharacterized protein n=1 Tax=Microdochium trichocladiopsis TaxID=1682393 RepID=A0A9P9BRF0_9PEZI|nr:uncharacterized protein B0I36DRAFT_430206 [Microdochium trichocladiopsis]KAH7032831.1 hypothetical protein B0I36DRAFT_430206 [Microdochium trichocladiopsis]